jgi:hypothetical protein
MYDTKLGKDISSSCQMEIKGWDLRFIIDTLYHHVDTH